MVRELEGVTIVGLALELHVQTIDCCCGAGVFCVAAHSVWPALLKSRAG